MSEIEELRAERDFLLNALVPHFLPLRWSPFLFGKVLGVRGHRVR